MLKDKMILIVEDNAYIAMNLAMSVEDLGGLVAGPVGSVEEALALLSEELVAAAVLDCELIDRDITPVVMRLIDEGVPFVFHTGTSVPVALAAIHPGLPVVLKPLHSEAVLHALAIEMRRMSGTL